jgi:hypothetical protein
LPRYPTRETYAPRTCIVCRESFRPERWDQSYCGNKCAQVVNRFLAGKVLETAAAIVRQDITCWNCCEVKYPKIYVALLRPWLIMQDPGAITERDYVALCSVCKLPVRLMLALGAYSEEG